MYRAIKLDPKGVVSVTFDPKMRPRFQHGSWWAYSPEHDSDTGPYSTEKEAQDFCDLKNQ